MTQLELLKGRLSITGTDEDSKLEAILEDAAFEILDHCNRDTLPLRAQALQRELAIIYYNRQGSEGESSRSEGGVSVSYSNEIPESIKKRLKSFRLLKGARIANETE